MHDDKVISTPASPNQAVRTCPTTGRRFLTTEDGRTYLLPRQRPHRPSQPAAPKTPPVESVDPVEPAEQPVLPVVSAPQQVPQAELPPPQAPRYIPLKTVLERAGGFSKSAWHDWSNPASPRYDPTIPRSVCLSVTGRGCVRWVEAEVDAWLAAKAVAGRKQYAAPGTKTVAARKKGTTSSKVNAAQCTESASVVAKLVDA